VPLPKSIKKRENSMLVKSSFFFGLAILVSSAQAQSAFPEILQDARFATPAALSALGRMKWELGREGADLSPKNSRVENDLSSSMQELIDSYQVIDVSYQTQMNYLTSAKTTVELGKLLFDSLATGAGAKGGLSSAGGMAAAKIAVAGATYVAAKALDASLKEAENARTESALAILGHSVALLRERDRTTAEQVLGSGNLKEAERALIGPASLLLADDFYKKLAPEHQGILSLQLSLTLAQAGAIEKLRNHAFKQNTLAALENHESRIVSLTKTFYAFREKTVQAIGQIQNQQHALLESVDHIQNTVSRQGADLSLNQQDIATLQNVLWGKMSSRERYDALKEGFYARLPPLEREKLLEKLEPLKMRDEILASTQTIFAGAQAFSGLARHFGVDPHVLRAIDTSVAIGQNVTKIGTALFSPRPDLIGLANGISGLLGIGGADVGQIRHQQLLGRLDALLDGQREILERTRRIIENQQLILKGIEHLSRQIESTRREIVDRLERLERDVQTNTLMLAGIAENLTYKDCREFLDSRFLDGASTTQSQWSMEGFQRGSFLSYASMSEFFSSTNLFASCVAAFNRVSISPTTGIPSLLLTESVPQQGVPADLRDWVVKIQDFRDKIYLPTLRYTLQSRDYQNSAQLMSSLSTPLARVGTLESKGKTDPQLRAEFGPFQLGNSARPPYALLLEKHILPTALKTLVEDAFELSLFAELRDSRDSTRLVPEEKIVGGSAGEGLKLYSMDAHRWFTRLRDITQVAIAQQSLLSGESILNSIEGALALDKPRDPTRAKAHQELRPQAAAHECQTADAYFNTVCLLEHNPYVASNLALSVVLGRLRAQGARSYAAYRAAFLKAEPRARYMAYVLGEEMTFEVEKTAKGNRWWIPLVGTNGNVLKLALPNPRALEESRVTYPLPMEELLSLRARLEERIKFIRWAQELQTKPMQSQLYRSILLRSPGLF
jgi:hypothetical protein